MKWCGTVLVACVLTLTGCTGDGDDGLASSANEIMQTVYGICFSVISDESLADATVVETETADDGVVTVEVVLAPKDADEETRYRFRVNTGLGDHDDDPEPGDAVPLNAAAEGLAESCP